MYVPFVDLKCQYERIKGEILKEIGEVLDNTAYISGKKVHQFEEAFAQAHNARYCTAVSSGTDALHTALRAIGIKHGDEVIIPVNTFIATSAAVSQCGAKPVFVDNDSRTYNIDASRIEAAITERTRAIIPVHLYGQSAEMQPILEIAKIHNLSVIEDCSQAHLGEYKGKKIGTMGIIGTFSFYPGKNLGAYGEGGATITNSEELYNKMRRFRQHGSVTKYLHEFEGCNYRMEEIQAGVLNVKIKYLNEWTENRRKIADRYTESLSGMNGEVVTPYCPDYIKHVYHLYIVRVKDRDGLQKYLAGKGIQTMLHYPMPLHKQQAYSYLNYKEGDFPVAEEQCTRILSLPMYPEMRMEQVDYVCDEIRKYYNAG
jgi:dTDP-4-amino-4,6-dideoxygalactose transaminase